MELLNVAKLSSNPWFLSLILLFFSILVWLQLTKRKTLNLPPSPPRLPIIGNIHQLGKLPHRSFRDLSRKYGSLLLLHLGHNPTLLVSSPDLVKEIFKNNDIMFSNRPRTTAVDKMFYDMKGMGFAPYGEFWKQARKMSVVELLSHRRVLSFQFVREEEVEVVINKIRSASLKRESVYLSEMLNFVSSNIVSRCVLSHKSEGEDGCSKFGQLVKRVLMQQGWHLRDGSHSRQHQSNLTGYLFNKDLFVGGTSTSTTAMEWMMAELLKHPHVMKKVQQEVRDVVEKKSKVDMGDVSKMEYLKCVMKETLRLHPPVVLVPRKTSASVKLGGYDIPKDTTVMVNAWDIHRDPKWWEKPEEFIPERFENSSIDFQGQDFHYIPFGFGRRACPGLSFGVASTEYVIANLLYWFDWKLLEGEIAENIDMTELYGLSVSMKTPLNVMPITPLESHYV